MVRSARLVPKMEISPPGATGADAAKLAAWSSAPGGTIGVPLGRNVPINCATPVCKVCCDPNLTYAARTVAVTVPPAPGKLIGRHVPAHCPLPSCTSRISASPLENEADTGVEAPDSGTNGFPQPSTTFTRNATGCPTAATNSSRSEVHSTSRSGD